MVPNSAAQPRQSNSGPLPSDGAAESVAAIYNQAGDRYLAYADGDPKRLFSFDRLSGYADQRVWDLLDARLVERGCSGARTIRILDAGCGPGTWLRRLVTRARALGFTEITARGFDIAQAQIQRARLLTRDLSRQPGVNLTFDVADLIERLPEPDHSVDITLCLYSVLSHLPVASLTKISAELARVTSGQFIATVRPVGSTPTILVDSIEKARRLKLDHDRDRCEIEFSDGRRVAFGFHLFTVSELQRCFGRHFHIEHLSGLDLFHGRFAPDPRWNPALPADSRLAERLARLEAAYATDPSFMERAAHLLLVGRNRQAPNPLAT
jgi:SAM-dependent methyltransferase